MQKQYPNALGKHVTLIETRGFVLTDSKHRPNLPIDRHSHENANLACVIQGSFAQRMGGKNFECYPHDILLEPAGESHATFYQRAGAHCLAIEVQPQLLNYFLPKGLDKIQHIQKAQKFDLVSRIYREINIADEVSKMSVESLILELLAYLTRHKNKGNESRSPRWLMKAKDFIHANFADQITLSSIAETIDIHPTHFTRVFRKHFHCSVGDYIRRLRLEYVSEQLIQTEETLAKIAHAAGFYDQSHCTNAFKKHTGLTPAEYRSAKK